MNWRNLLFAGIFALSTYAAQAAERDEPPSQPAPSQAELDEKFADSLKGVVFEGRWCLIEDGELTEEKQDSYRILSAQKAGGDLWIIRAEMKYGDQVVAVPVPVHVKWAGDTPVITLNENAQLPQLGRYSARVVVHQGAYAGTWSGGEKKGLLHGVIRSQ